MAFYVDTSALTKLVVEEAESLAFREWSSVEGRVLVSSDLTRTELMRTVRRHAPDQTVQARSVLESITVLRLTPELCETAGRLDPIEALRSLDAVHLAAALDFGDELEGLVTYDERLAAAAEANGIPAIAPA